LPAESRLFGERDTLGLGVGLDDRLGDRVTEGVGEAVGDSETVEVRLAVGVTDGVGLGVGLGVDVGLGLAETEADAAEAEAVDVGVGALGSYPTSPTARALSVAELSTTQSDHARDWQAGCWKVPRMATSFEEAMPGCVERM
jgi:hypothetical protein